jgi:hypothetical protein
LSIPNRIDWTRYFEFVRFGSVLLRAPFAALVRHGHSKAVQVLTIPLGLGEVIPFVPALLGGLVNDILSYCHPLTCLLAPISVSFLPRSVAMSPVGQSFF